MYCVELRPSRNEFLDLESPTWLQCGSFARRWAGHIETGETSRSDQPWVLHKVVTIKHRRLLAQRTRRFVAFTTVAPT
jgi:hypothetical protein